MQSDSFGHGVVVVVVMVGAVRGREGFQFAAVQQGGISEFTFLSPLELWTGD